MKNSGHPHAKPLIASENCETSIAQPRSLETARSGESNGIRNKHNKLISTEKLQYYMLPEANPG